MLILSRRIGEEIIIDGGIRIVVISLHGSNVKLGIVAPDDTTILRGEIDDYRDNRDRLDQGDETPDA